MDWFSGELVITSDGWTILYRKPGISLLVAQFELDQWRREHPNQQYFATYNPSPLDMGHS
jgi:hypothetical protein